LFCLPGDVLKCQQWGCDPGPFESKFEHIADEHGAFFDGTIIGLKIAKGVTVFRPSTFCKWVRALDPTPVLVAEQKGFIQD